MKTPFKILPFCLLAFFSNAASASISLLSTSDGNGADTTVRENAPRNPDGARDAIFAYIGGATPNLGSLHNASLAYIRFDLSTISNPITDVSLSLTSLITYGGHAEYAIYGLNDGHLNENWSEATATWNNPPASFQDDFGGLTSSEVLLLKTGVFSPQEDSSVSFSSEALNLFVQNDTDNLVTFILKDINSFNDLSTDIVFYSKENTIPSFAPTLSVTTVPVPVAFWLFGSALIGLMGTKKYI